MNVAAPRFVVTQDGATLNVYHANKGEGLPQHEHVFSPLDYVPRWFYKSQQ